MDVFVAVLSYGPPRVIGAYRTYEQAMDGAKEWWDKWSCAEFSEDYILVEEVHLE